MRQAFLSIARFGLLTTVIAAAFLPGCGGDEEASVTVEPGPLAKPDFIKRADAICIATRAQYDKRYEAFLERTSSTFSEGNKDALSRELVEEVVAPTFEINVDQISALGAPEGDEEIVSSFLTALQESLEEVREDPSKLTGDLLARPAKLARAYGLKRCAQSLS